MSTPHILVIEDDDAIATLIQYNLEKEGYEVAIAGDGEEGLVHLPTELVEQWPAGTLVRIEPDGDDRLIVSREESS